MARKLRTGLGIAGLAPEYFALAILKKFVRLETLARWTWRQPSRKRDPAAEQRTVAQIVRFAHLLGTADRDCLQRSLLLYRRLSAMNASPELVVGVRREAAQVHGHVWVTVDGIALAETPQSLARFVIIAAYGVGGQRTVASSQTAMPPRDMLRP